MKKLTKLDKVYEDINQTYGGATEEQMQGTIQDLQKEIEGKKISLENMQDNDDKKREGLQKNIENLEKRMDNLKGYSKNKVQIQKIKEYKNTLEQKLSSEVSKKENYDNNLKTLIPELKEVLKKLKDEKYTMSLDQYQYNDLLEKKETLSNAVKTNKEGKELAAKRITELKAKIGKCDLAWKTLFVNKDWDEIQRRAISDEKRFTRKIDSKNPPIKQNNKEKEEQTKNKGEAPTVENEVEDYINGIMDAEIEVLPATISRWDKIKNFFKNIPNKLKAAFGRENGSEKDSTTQDSKTSKNKDRKNETRDQFLEGLRQHVDEEYRQQVKEEKQKAYIESHKAKPKETEEVEK